MKYRKTLIYAIFVFLLSIICSGCFICSIQKTKAEITHERVQYIAASQVDKLQSCIENYLDIAVTWEMLVIENDGIIKNFDQIASLLYDDDSAVSSIQLAPNGVVTQVYPLEGNEEAFGDLFSDPDRKLEAEIARDTGKMTLSGPFELYQGGLGAVVRQPVYLKNAKGKQEFWGFTIAVLDIEKILEAANIQGMSEEGYKYKLWRVHPDTGDVQVIAQSCAENLSNPVQFYLEVPNATWMLDVEPVYGWFNYFELIFHILIGLLLSSLLALIAGLIVRLNGQKNQMTSLSYTDSLTGLNNLRKFYEILDVYTKKKEAFGVIYFDLNGFKKVNDNYGHNIGDQLLIAVAGRLKDSIRTNDFAFRIGGDEFLVVLDGHFEEEYYRNKIKTVKQILEQDIIVEDIALHTSTSAGFARYPEDSTDAEDIIKSADHKMYAEKAKV